MAGGLNLHTMGGVKASASVGSTGSTPQNSTATQAAFGGTSGGADSTTAALTPNDAFGTAFWLALAAVGALLLIRHSLPR